jgi:uncharacterized membrane protein
VYIESCFVRTNLGVGKGGHKKGEAVVGDVEVARVASVVGVLEVGRRPVRVGRYADHHLVAVRNTQTGRAATVREEERREEEKRRGERERYGYVPLLRAVGRA